MTNNDLNQIGALMDKKLSATEERLRQEISSTEDKLDQKLVATEERLRQEISSTEDKLDQKLVATEERLKGEIVASGKRIMVDIGAFMEDTLFPMLNEKLDEKADKTDIDRIERKLDRVLDTNFNHERRIKDIESVPVIAHELKRRKPKQL